MNNRSQPSVETPSGKDAAYENFPVGSWLLPAALRPHIATFYQFARAIDDIADSPNLDPGDKVARLDGFASVLKDGHNEGDAFETGVRMRISLQETDIPTRHCLDLIDAFKQDAVKKRYDDWQDLMAYCTRSASPVGRYLIDLHGGSDNGYGPSDALCNALQVINHLQDCKEDYLTLDRVYLPGDWMGEEGMDVEALAKDRSSRPVRRVINRTLSATEDLMDEAWTLPVGLRSRRLAMESAAILHIAERLIARLRTEDPLVARVALTKPGYAWQCIRGAIPVAFGLWPQRRPV
tara:strand:+ start:824 stop:1702 length:879 start_codon:yes stop_codon:yes gene_type:complete